MPSSEMSDDDLVASWDIVSRAVARTHERILDSIVDAHSHGWFAVLHLLLHNREHQLPMTHLARELSITTGGFTKLADRMGQEGLIDRRNSSGDRRVVYATLTAEGLQVARRSEHQYKAALREHVLAVLTSARLAALADSAVVLSEAHAVAPQPPAPIPATQPRADRPERRRLRSE